MNIGVIGVGRLGLCFALLLDQAGFRVWACDIRSNYIAGLRRGEIHTNEPRVQDLVKNCSVEFTTDTRSVIQHSDVIYVMVATPSRTDGGYDISAVERVVQDVNDSDFDLSGKIVVIGCTTNPGDCQRIQDHLRHRDVSVLYNPEFIAQGSILQDLQTADIVLIGGEDPKVIESYGKIYQGIQQDPKIHGMSLTAAEVVKIATNCFLTTKISYANMVGEVLTRAGLQQDIDAALMAIGSDRRIGHNYLRYGFGYGGPCLPRDNRAFAHYATSLGMDFPLGHIVDEFNHRHTVFLAEYFESINVQGLPFYMRHLSYKPNTDIYEESQQLRLAEVLLAKGHDIIVEPTDLMPQQLIQRLKNQYTNLQYRPILDQDHYLEIPT